MGPLIRGIKRADEAVNYWSAALAGMMLFASMFYAVFDVIGRYIFNHPLVGAVETSESVLVATTFLAATYHEIKTGHIKMDLMIMYLSPGWKTGLGIFVRAAVATVFFLLARQNWIYTSMLWNSKAVVIGALGLPIWIPVSTIFIGSSLFFLHSLGSLLGTVINLIHPGTEAS